MPRPHRLIVITLLSLFTLAPTTVFADVTLTNRNQNSNVQLFFFESDAQASTSLISATTEASATRTNPALFTGTQSASADLDLTFIFDGDNSLTSFNGSGALDVNAPTGSSYTSAKSLVELQFTVDENTSFNLDLTPLSPSTYFEVFPDLGEEEEEPSPLAGTAGEYQIFGPNGFPAMREFNQGSGLSAELIPGDYVFFIQFLADAYQSDQTFDLNFNFSATFGDVVATTTDYHWDNSGGGSFGNSDNWQEDQFPDANNETARFDLSDSYTVTFPSGFENNSAVVSAGNVTFDLNANTYLLNSNTDAGLVVESTDAQLTVINGNVNATKINVLDNATLNINGTTDVQAANDIRVSGPLASILNITNGADASTSGDLFLGGTSGNGLMTLDNATFTAFNSIFAAGSLSGFNAENGANAAVANQLNLSSDASAFIDGVGTFVGAAQLVTVSNSRFEVTNGASAEFASASINGPAIPPINPLPAHLEASGTDSKVEITNALEIGHSNAADILVDDSATLAAGSLDHQGGSITVSNLASLTLNGHAQISSNSGVAGITVNSGGIFAADALTLDNLAVFQLSGTAPMIPDGGSSVIVANTINVFGFSVFDIAGGAVLGAAAMAIGDSSGVSVTGDDSAIVVFESISVAGRLDVNNNAGVTADGIIVDSTGMVTGNGGTITVANIINDEGGFINMGLLSPGSSPGILNIVGDYLQPEDGVLLVEIAGLTPGSQHDQLLIDGNATIQGDVTFRFIDGFAPSMGDTVDFLQVSGSGDLSDSNYHFEGLKPGFEFSVAPLNGGFRFTALNDGRLICDFNEDGVCDIADMDILGEASAAGIDDPQFDVNGDSFVNGQDIIDYTAPNSGFCTWLGDVDGDGQFGTGDLVKVFGDGKYENGQAALYTEGDWNGDGFFTTSDLVAAFRVGEYENGPRCSERIQTVPEPTGSLLLTFGFLGLVGACQRCP